MNTGYRPKKSRHSSSETCGGCNAFCASSLTAIFSVNRLDDDHSYVLSTHGLFDDRLYTPLQSDDRRQ